MFSQNVEEGVDWSYLLGLCLSTHKIIKNVEMVNFQFIDQVKSL